MDEVNTIAEVDEVIVVTNNRYYEHFVNWSEHVYTPKKLTILNDNTNSNDDRLGAIGDINFTIDELNINDDLLIIAGDSLFDFKLKDFVDFYKKKKEPIVSCERLKDNETLKRVAVVSLDENNKIVDLVEKPENPQSDIAAYAMYLYPKDVIKDIKTYLAEGNKPDAPGYLLEYLYPKKDVYAYVFKGAFYDVGTHDSLKEVREIYGKID